MELMLDFVQMSLPAALAVYGMFLVVKTMMEKQVASELQKLNASPKEQITELRLQAYERMTLYLERITPNNLIMRLNGSADTVSDFQAVLVNEIRNEYNYNCSQQIYLEEGSWALIKQGTEETIALINQAGKELKSDQSAYELSKKVFEIIIQSEFQIIDQALSELKKEVKKIY
ncbi:DUF7935 family protein [Sediminitomix flava]|uniref:Uncharacterized protein n=1 Tax=Sediminitomix flava TaxID=379075 RepID=A0A315ZAB0_SEDFL|nr:hypothetical protein [Sediminitomix flava]PWJ42212.1 hypothetical protein BC781_103463 [Sediminitomix flava]